MVLLLAVGLWILSYGSRYMLDERDLWRRRVVVVSRGEIGMGIWYASGDTPESTPTDVQRKWTRSSPDDLSGEVHPLSSGMRSPVAGFFFTRHIDTIVIPFPIPFVVVVFALLPLADVILIRRRRRRGRRLAAGLCVRCGCDLRASSDRCPECGAIPAATHSV